jgi:hypothetical protein
MRPVEFERDPCRPKRWGDAQQQEQGYPEVKVVGEDFGNSHQEID